MDTGKRGVQVRAGVQLLSFAWLSLDGVISLKHFAVLETPDMILELAIILKNSC